MGGAYPWNCAMPSPVTALGGHTRQRLRHFNFFYNLKNPRCWRKRIAFGRVFPGSEALELGGDPGKRYHLALRVWGMGELGSVDVAQYTHEGILESGGAVSRERQMVYGRPLPRQKVFQEIYTDDHFMFGVVPRNRLIILRRRTIQTSLQKHTLATRRQTYRSPRRNVLPTTQTS